MGHHGDNRRSVLFGSWRPRGRNGRPEGGYALLIQGEFAGQRIVVFRLRIPHGFAESFGSIF